MSNYFPIFDEPYQISYGGGYNDHNHDQLQGIDLVIEDSKQTFKKPVYAACEGMGYMLIDPLGAKYWLIRNDDLLFFYVHLDSFVGSDRYIQKGDLIGYAGNTGFVMPPPTAQEPWNGTHLHFMVWQNGNNIDPTPYINFNVNSLPFTQQEMDTIINMLSQIQNSINQVASNISYPFSSRADIVEFKDLVIFTYCVNKTIYTMYLEDGKWSTPLASGETNDKPVTTLVDNKIIQLCVGTDNLPWTRSSTDGKKWSKWIYVEPKQK